jgi:hypothetical protein
MKKKETGKRAVAAKSRPDSLSLLLCEVRDLIASARRSAASVVNTLQVMDQFPDRSPHRRA